MRLLIVTNAKAYILHVYYRYLLRIAMGKWLRAEETPAHLVRAAPVRLADIRNL